MNAISLSELLEGKVYVFTKPEDHTKHAEVLYIPHNQLFYFWFEMQLIGKYKHFGHLKRRVSKFIRKYRLIPIKP